MAKVVYGFLVLMTTLLPCHSLDNGLARLPPLGWMTGERFGCNVDCFNYPSDCISEGLVKSMVDTFVNNGYQNAGYQYLVVDDCWQAKSRDAHGKLQPDPTRFPSGLNSLADYIHKRGLKLGLYLDVGNVTCNGYPGSMGHLQTDAQTVAGWGVDMVKVGACNIDRGETLNTAYPQLGQYLNQTGRPILYMCEWPKVLRDKGMQVDFTKVDQVCNQFRTHDDTYDSWESLHDTVKYYGDNGRQLLNYSKPGSWNDPDQLVVGDFGLSPGQQRMQMAIWSIMAAPLFVSADLRNINLDSRSVLLNKKALAVNQDPLGVMGIQVTVKGQVRIWKKPTMPKGSFALALLYENVSGGPSKVSVKIQDLGLTTAAAYNMTEIFTGHFFGTYKPWYTLNCEVNPTGVLFIEALALP